MGLEMVMPDRKVIDGKYIIEDMPLTTEQCVEAAVESGRKLKEYLADVSSEVYNALMAEKNVVIQERRARCLT